MKYKKYIIQFIICFAIMFFSSNSLKTNIYAQDVNTPLPSIGINIGTSDTPEETTSTLQILLLFTVISLAPSLLIMLTCFTRIIISLHFLRSALGTQQMPPNQILIGLALFLTFFIMAPNFTQINEKAIQPYSQGQIDQEEFLVQAMAPIRDFMFSQVEDKDLALFTNLSNIESYESRDDIPNTVLIPAFIIGELTKGFKIGFVLYIPFIAIDMVVASTLMAMGMMMLPPALISAPFKLLLFIMVDGWSFIIENIVRTFST